MTDRARTGQDSCLQQVLAEHGPALWRLAGTFEFDRARREDLFQETLVAIWRALPRLENPAGLKAYVFRIARNRAMSHIAAEIKAGPTRAPDEQQPAVTNCPYTDAEQHERHRRLRQAVNGLPLGQREAVTLFLEGFSHAEIAEVLDISENNVAVRINRARTQLASRLSS